MSAAFNQNPIPWPAAHKELQKVRKDIADALDALYWSLPEKDRLGLQVAVVEYPYGDKVVDDGYALWPDQTEIPSEYIIAERFPLGIVLENVCEVADLIFTSDRLEKVSQALIYPGGGIGIFELADHLTDVPKPQAPNWHITAGATCTYVLPNLTTDQNRRLIRTQLGEDVDALKLTRSWAWQPLSGFGGAGMFASSIFPHHGLSEFKTPILSDQKYKLFS
jgi:hypothetical protein